MIYLKLILATVVWGLTPSINKILSHYDSPFLITFFRFFFAAFIFFFFLKTLGKKIIVGKSNLLFFFLLGFFGFVLHNAMMVKGLEGTSAGLTSVIMSLIVVLVVLIDWVILKSIPSLQVILGIILSITGVYFVVFDRFSLDSNNFFDEFFIFLSALSWAIYTVMCRDALKQHDEIVVLTYATFFAVLFLTPVPLVQSGLVAEIIVDPLPMLLLVFTGLVSSALTFFWHQQAIRKIGIVTTSVFLNLVPVFGVISASLILKEEINIRMAIGTIITVGGILIVTIFYRPRGQN